MIIDRFITEELLTERIPNKYVDLVCVRWEIDFLIKNEDNQSIENHKIGDFISLWKLFMISNSRRIGLSTIYSSEVVQD